MSPSDDLFWQDEILQALYWLAGEGLADSADSAELARLLVAPRRTVVRQLRRLCERGYLERVAGKGLRYRLTDLGRQEGGRSFADEFAELTKPGHGECKPGCWCHDPAHAGEPCPSV
jgi:hypothetical protein